MKILAMFVNTPGMPDLVHHTVKHFLGDRERGAWDRVAAGTILAKTAWEQVRREVGVRPRRGRFPETRWWDTPWKELAVSAHDCGYGPRYLHLVEMVGDPAGPRWAPGDKDKRFAEHSGFQLVVAPQGRDFQVVTAFLRSIFSDVAQVTKPALRAFSSRGNCPAGPLPGVPKGETK